MTETRFNYLNPIYEKAIGSLETLRIESLTLTV